MYNVWTTCDIAKFINDREGGAERKKLKDDEKCWFYASSRESDNDQFKKKERKMEGWWLSD